MDEESQDRKRITVIIPIICQYLAPFVDDRVKWFHNDLTKTHGSKTCKRNCRLFGNWLSRSCSICSKWKNSLEHNYYTLNSRNGKPSWSNSDPKLWPCDAWEVAKVYMNRGQRPGKQIRSVDELDISMMLNLILHCKVFGTNQEWKALVNEVLSMHHEVFHDPSKKLPDGRFDQFQKILIRFIDVGYHNFEDMPEKADITKKIMQLKTVSVRVSNDQWLTGDLKQMWKVVNAKLKEHDDKLEHQAEMLQDIRVTQDGMKETQDSIVRQLGDCIQQQTFTKGNKIKIPGNQDKFTRNHPVPIQQSRSDHIKPSSRQHILSRALCQDNKHYTPAAVSAILRTLENVNSSPKEAEQHLAENCRRAGLQIRGKTPADGNCGFHAISDQLNLLRLPYQSAKQLRKKVVAFLRSNPQIPGPDGVINLQFYTQLNWTSYLESMSKDGTWIDGVVLVAMAHMLKRDIMVVTSSPTDDDAYLHWIVGDVQLVGPGATPIRLGHAGEIHYESLEPINSSRLETPVDYNLKHNPHGYILVPPMPAAYNEPSWNPAQLPSSVTVSAGSCDSIRSLCTDGGYMGDQTQETTVLERPCESIQLYNSVHGNTFDITPQQKRILLLSLKDGDKHVNTVYCLKEVLQQRYCCDVTMLDDHMDANDDFLAWFDKQKSQAYRIVIIFSKGAGVYPDVFLPERKHAPLSKFWLAIRSCLDDFERSSRENYTIAYFDYSSREDVIPPMKRGAVYELPRQLNKLVFQIHNINPVGPGYNYQDSKLNLESTNDASSMSLSLAIEESRDFMISIRQNEQEFDAEYATLKSQDYNPQMLATFFAQSQTGSY